MERSLLGLVFIQGFFGSSPCMTCFSLESGYGEAASKLGVFSSFSFISLHTCFMLPPMMMGLSPRLFDFSFSGSSLLHFALSSVVFCLDFDPYFFFLSLVPLPCVFPFFIYLFIKK